MILHGSFVVPTFFVLFCQPLLFRQPDRDSLPPGPVSSFSTGFRLTFCLAFRPTSRHPYIDRALRACVRARAAPDALGGIRFPDGIDFHLAYIFALAAVYAAVFIHFQTAQADLVHDAVNSPERTERAAEKPIYEDAAHDRQDQYCHFQRKKGADRPPQLLVRTEQRDPALQCARRTDILAKSRFSHAHIIGHCDREHEDKHDKDQIFEIPKYFL